jgi:hypothetical protein
MVTQDIRRIIPTQIAVLGTLAEFHHEPIPYDMAALVSLVTKINPDMLCLEMTPEQWQQRDFSQLPPEFGEALLPLAHQTDMVVVPVAGDSPPEPTAPGLRGTLIRLIRRWLAALQKRAPNPASINSGWRHFIADLFYILIDWLAGRHTRSVWKQHTDRVVMEVLNAIRRDPGCRVLVVANVRHCHHIRYKLKKYPEVQTVSFNEL